MEKINETKEQTIKERLNSIIKKGIIVYSKPGCFYEAYLEQFKLGNEEPKTIELCEETFHLFNDRGTEFVIKPHRMGVKDGNESYPREIYVFMEAGDKFEKNPFFTKTYEFAKSIGIEIEENYFRFEIRAIEDNDKQYKRTHFFALPSRSYGKQMLDLNEYSSSSEMIV